ncbi:MAG: mercury(II) reductase [Chloroflexota bacterium]
MSTIGHKRFDLVILGSGSTAFAAAIRAAELGRTAAMTESRVLGGTCVNRGCLPSKNLIEAARIYWESRNPRYPGLLPASMGLDFRQLVRQKDDVVADYRARKYEAIVADSDSIEVFEGHASFLDDHSVSVNGAVLEADKFLIATGARPLVPAIDGLDRVPYLTSDLLSVDEPMELVEQPESLLVVGAGYIALELGQMFQRLGTKVTMLQRGEQLLREYEPEIGEALLDILADEGMDIHLGAMPLSVREDAGQVVLTARVGGRQRELRAANLLVATGRRPNSDDIGLERVGVTLDRYGAVKVDDELRTSAQHIYAGGDVIGSQTNSQMATPVGAHDGVIAADNSLNEARRKVNHSVIPRAIFTDPQVGVVGFTDEQATAAGYRCRCNTVPISVVPRAGVIRDTRGVVKMVLDDETKRVLGVSMLGANAGEVIHEAAMAMRFGATAYDFIDQIHVYPTMAEALKIAALSFFKDVEKLSCCAE